MKDINRREFMVMGTVAASAAVAGRGEIASVLAGKNPLASPTEVARSLPLARPGGVKGGTTEAVITKLTEARLERSRAIYASVVSVREDVRRQLDAS